MYVRSKRIEGIFTITSLKAGVTVQKYARKLSEVSVSTHSCLQVEPQALGVRPMLPADLCELHGYRHTRTGTNTDARQYPSNILTGCEFCNCP